MSDFDEKKYEYNEDLKRRIRYKFSSFPKISFIIYIIFALSNIILMGYLLTLNENEDTNFTNFIIIWSLYIFYIILFLINCVLFILEFPFKKWIIGIFMILEAGLAGSCILAAQFFGHIGPSDQLYYFVSHALNIFVTIIGFIPLYLVY